MQTYTLGIVLTMLLIVGAGMSFAVSKARRTDRDRIGVRRAGAMMLVIGLVSTMGATVFMPSARAALSDFTVPPGVTMTEGGEDCHGVVPTPGSANTNKVLDPDAVQDLNPGGSVSYLITFPTNANNVGTFEIVDCVLLVGPGGAPKDFKTVLGQVSFSKVNNSAEFKLAFKFAIPANAANGDQICNVAKTTASPSKSPASNRKAGPACFVIGGSGRVEKHDADNPTLKLDGATFSIHDCRLGAGANPALQPIIVSLQNAAGASIAGAPIAGDNGLVSGTVTAASIAFNGPSGSSCQVTETAPPPGYSLPPVGERTVTVLIGANRQTTYNFNDKAIPTQLTLTKIRDAETVSAGSPIGFTITISNAAGAATAQNVTINDPLPSGPGIVWSISPAVAGCSIAGNPAVLACSFGDLAGGASRTVHITSPTTLESCAAYQNTARVASTNGSAPPASATSTVQCPGLNLTKTADAPLVDAGSQIGFTVTVSNTAGSAPATGVTISDPLPTGTGIAWSLAPAVTGCEIVGNQLNCVFPTLAAGASQAVHVISPTTKDSCKAYPNTASMTAPTAKVADALLTVQCPVVTLAKTADAPTVNAGEPIGFVITVSNAGPATATAVVVSDTLPSGDGLSWSIASDRNGDLCTLTGNALSCDFGDLAADASRSVHVTSTTTAAACRAIPNTASAALANGPTPDPAAASTTVNCPALTLGKVADAASVAAGQPIGFTITVSNGANAGTARAVTVTDDLLAGAGVAWSVDPASADAASCAIAGGKLTCSFGDLVAGASRSVHVLSPTTEASCKTYDNTAKLTATNGSAPDATASTAANCPPPVAVLPLAEVPQEQAFIPAAPAPAPPLAEVQGLVVLPRTGSGAAPLARIGGIALMLGALGLLAGSRRKETA